MRCRQPRRAFVIDVFFPVRTVSGEGSIPLEILPQTTLRTMGPQGTSRLARLSPGDLIEARVLRLTANGQTLLQVGQSKIIAEQHLGAKPGDVLRLEVQKAPHPTNLTGRARLWFTVQRFVTAPPTQALSAPQASGEQFLALKGRGPHFVSTDVFRPRADAPRIDGVPSALTESSAARLLAPAALINGKRIQSLRKRVLRRAANPAVTLKTHAFREARPQPTHVTKAAPHQLATESRELMTPFEYIVDFGFDPSREGNAALRIKLKPGQGSRRRPDAERALRASLLLDLENTGVIEVNLTMDEDHIWVEFITSTAPMRQKLEAELGDVYAALTALVKKVNFQVRSDRRLLAQDLFAEGHQYVPGEIDLNI